MNTHFNSTLWAITMSFSPFDAILKNYILPTQYRYTRYRLRWHV